MHCPVYERLVEISWQCFNEIKSLFIRAGSHDHDPRSHDHDPIVRFQQLDFEAGPDDEDDVPSPLISRSDLYKVRDLERQLSEPADLEVECLLHDTAWLPWQRVVWFRSLFIAWYIFWNVMFMKSGRVLVWVCVYLIVVWLIVLSNIIIMVLICIDDCVNGCNFTDCWFRWCSYKRLINLNHKVDKSKSLEFKVITEMKDNYSLWCLLHMITQ